ncbi:MAG: hypothetical protein Q8P07_02900 [bacterium]|nr:hypothetical protein [bacterium]
MVNLLSKESKEAQLEAYKKKLLALVLFAAAVVLCVASLILLPFVLQYRNANSLYLSETVRINNYLETTTLESGDAEAQEVGRLLTGIHTVLGARSFSGVIQKIVSAVPPSVTVLSIVAKNEQQVELSGEATDRQSLVDFADALKQTEGVSHVDVPITNFIEGVDVAYRITFYLESYE